MLRVITYNLHKGTGKRNEDILAAAADALAERQPDILLCQEVFHGVADRVKQCHFITAVTGHDHVFGPNAFYGRGCHGNATFSRLPIGHRQNINVTESFFEKRGILHTVLDNSSESGKPIDILNVHFSLTSRQRRRQWRKLCDVLPEDRSVPVLACGDFNDWAGSLDRHVRRSGHLQNVMWKLPRVQRRSFPASRPRFALDRIYQRGFRIHEVCVLSGAPWDSLSDHLPVEVILEAEA